MPQTSSPFSGTVEDSEMSKGLHKAEGLIPTMGQEGRSTRDEGTKCYRRKLRERTFLIGSYGWDCRLPPQYLFSTSSLVTESPISSWDHGCLEWNHISQFPLQLVATWLCSGQWDVSKAETSFSEVGTALCPLILPAPRLFSTITLEWA